MRHMLVLTAMFLSACATGDSRMSEERVVSDLGGERIVWINGVCLIQHSSEEEHLTYIVPDSRCDGG